MSKLGNIRLSYGKQFNVAVANTYSNIVLSGSNLPANTIIVTSATDDKNNDIGSYSLLVTDSLGNPVRLTYCIEPGNGLNVDSNDGDVIRIMIDNNSIKDSAAGLTIDLSAFEQTNVHNTNNVLSVTTNELPVASTSSRGITAVDGKTVKSDNYTLYIDTDELRYGDNGSSSYGMIKSTDSILVVENGVMSIDSTALPVASNESMGVCRFDDRTITTDGENVYVNTENLDTANETEFGIITADNNKILCSEGVLSVNTQALRKATSSTRGTLSFDGSIISLNETGQITIPSHTTIMERLNEINKKIEGEITSLDDIKTSIIEQVS